MKKISYLILAATAMIVATGCLKDKGYDNHEYGLNVGETKAVSIPQAPASPVAYSVPSQTTSQTVDAPDVELEANRPASSNVTVKLVLNNALLPSGVTPLPSNLYSIASLDVVIPAGQTKAHLVLTIPNSTLLDPTQLYGLGFQISSVDNGYQIASNMKSVVMTISVKNRFDGIYRLKGLVNMGGNTLAPHNVTVPCGNAYEVEMATSGPNSVLMSYQPVTYNTGALTIFNGLFPIDVQFNAANEVIDVNNLGTANGTYPYVFPDPAAPSYPSRYVPAEKTIYMRYRINNSGTWFAIDTLIFCRDR